MSGFGMFVCASTSELPCIGVYSPVLEPQDLHYTAAPQQESVQVTFLFASPGWVFWLWVERGCQAHCPYDMEAHGLWVLVSGSNVFQQARTTVINLLLGLIHSSWVFVCVFL